MPCIILPARNKKAGENHEVRPRGSLSKLTEVSDFDILAMAKVKAAVPVTVSIIMIINEGEKSKWDYLIFSRRIKKRKK